MKQVTLYTRVGCHLCDVMKEQLDEVRATRPFALDVVDIDQDPELRARYNVEVPVLVVEGEKIAKYRLDVAMLERRLDAPGGERGQATDHGPAGDGGKTSDRGGAQS